VAGSCMQCAPWVVQCNWRGTSCPDSCRQRHAPPSSRFFTHKKVFFLLFVSGDLPSSHRRGGLVSWVEERCSFHFFLSLFLHSKTSAVAAVMACPRVGRHQRDARGTGRSKRPMRQIDGSACRCTGPVRQVGVPPWPTWCLFS
jgi:hypothetical protein